MAQCLHAVDRGVDWLRQSWSLIQIWRLLATLNYLSIKIVLKIAINSHGKGTTAELFIVLFCFGFRFDFDFGSLFWIFGFCFEWGEFH